jgi:peroxiredoxin
MVDMHTDLSTLPATLPAPIEDGAAAHLARCRWPDIELPDTMDARINLARLQGRSIVYIYPMTGQPGVALPDGWDAIPGARGCTPQACDFRDHHAQLASLGARVFGLSVQTSEYQREVGARLHLPFPLLSDCKMQLHDHLRLPVFDVAGMRLYKRVTLIIEDGTIVKTFYPVFPPDQHATAVLAWLSLAENNSADHAFIGANA